MMMIHNDMVPDFKGIFLCAFNEIEVDQPITTRISEAPTTITHGAVF